MKGGSATKFLLETIFARALAEVGNVDLIPSPAPDAPMFAKPVTAEGLLQAFEITYRGAYNSLENVTPLMVAAGESLKQGGHVYYLSTGSIAVLTTIDASECPPTFGSKFTDVQAFVHNGWKNMGNRAGDLTSVSEKFHLSWDNFEKEALPNLTSADLVLYVDFDEDNNAAAADVQRLLQVVRQTPANLGALLIARRQQTETKLRGFLKQTVRVCAVVEVPYVEIVPGLRSFGELAAKFALNAISTYAHVAIGKVYKNRMIDLSVSNTKLFHRSVAIVSELMGVPLEEATTCLLRSIYLLDELTSDITQRPISQHLETATSGRSKVVPLALILASTPMPVAQAQEKLNAQPIVRKHIVEAAGSLRS
jgi:N-acetylmuramic acid 6-phosphate etherase